MDSRQDGLRHLIALVACGEVRALGNLYDATAARLLGCARRIAPNAAEDALQEAFIRIWRSAASFDASIAEPMAWMTTIARHTAIDIVRRTAERISNASDLLDEERTTVGENEALPTRQLMVCLESLGGERRAMVLLAYCYGYQRDELARRFGRPVGTVKTLLRRSLAALRDCIDAPGVAVPAVTVLQRGQTKSAAASVDVRAALAGPIVPSSG